MGEKDNFWDMGKTGPCGPCSEVVIDKGEEYGCGKSSCGPACECNRHLELWNLVFTQFERKENGSLEPLKQKNIDTGMGLERIASIMQEVPSVFDTDLLQPIISEVTDSPEQAKDIESARIIADHIRAITFCIADSVLPSNDGRGYVLRKLIRRAVQRGKSLGREKPFLHRLVPTVINGMSNFYPELKGRNKDIGLIVKAEEERFFAVFQKLPELEEEFRKLARRGEKQLPGDIYFKYYDTYGIPQETIKESGNSVGMEVDEEGFTKAMDSQRRRAREAGGFADSSKEIPLPSLLKGEKTGFTGYEELESNGTVLTIIRDSNEIAEAKKGETVSVVTDRTPFYGEAGGQAGDQGKITGEKWKLEVKDTRRYGETIVHEGIVAEGTLKKGDRVTLSVNTERRSGIAANHTVTHLLQYSLRQILGEHVRQCGSSVGPDRLRFDFTHTGAISEKDLSKVEEVVNSLVIKDSAVQILELPLKEAIKRGAIALFDEKYGEDVRVVKIDDYSMELCGGTHAHSTGEIGVFLIESESSIASGVRRIEAVSGRKAYLETKKARLILSEIGSILKTTPADIVERTKKLVETARNLQRKQESMRVQGVISKIEDYLSHAQIINGVKIISRMQEGLSQDGLRRLTDELKAKIGSGIIVLGTISDGKVSLLAGVTDDLTEKGWHAGKLIKEVASIVGGKGGGRADFAQAGGKTPERLKEAIESVPNIIKKLSAVSTQLSAKGGNG